MMKQLEIKKLQYDINRPTVKISGLSSGKTDKYEHLTTKAISHSRMEQQKKPIHIIHVLGKHWKNKQKQLKIMEKKQVKVLKSLEFSDKESPSIKKVYLRKGL